MGIFSKAAKASEVKGSESKKKSTVWLVGNNDESKSLSENIDKLIEINTEAKALEARATLLKNELKNHADGQLIRALAQTGVLPETPMNLQSSATGNKVTYVVQDKSMTANLSDEQIQELASTIGQDRVEELIGEVTQFAFDPDILQIPGVTEIVEKALGMAVKKLVDTNILNTEQADMLIKANTTRSFRHSVMPQFGLICGKDVSTMRDVLSTLGSAIVRYVKC